MTKGVYVIRQEEYNNLWMLIACGDNASVTHFINYILHHSWGYLHSDADIWVAYVQSKLFKLCNDYYDHHVSGIHNPVYDDYKHDCYIDVCKLLDEIRRLTWRMSLNGYTIQEQPVNKHTYLCVLMLE